MTEPITNRRGYALLEFARLANEEAINLAVHSPLTASIVVAEHEGNALFVFDRYKQSWEVPGGRIEPGESPRACAIRELMEESGQPAPDLDFVGLIKVGSKDGSVDFAAVYSCSLPKIAPFQANDEIEKTAFWDFQSDIGYIDEIDRYLAASVIGR